MEKQVLTIEQMQELKELGIDTSKASMRWVKFNKVPNMRYQLLSSMSEEDNDDIDNFEIIPTFTLQDILEILPKEIIKNRVHYIKCLDAYYDERYLFLYINREIHDILHEECDIPLKASFKMLKWCKQNNYI